MDVLSQTSLLLLATDGSPKARVENDSHHIGHGWACMGKMPVMKELLQPLGLPLSEDRWRKEDQEGKMRWGREEGELQWDSRWRWRERWERKHSGRKPWKEENCFEDVV